MDPPIEVEQLVRFDPPLSQHSETGIRDEIRAGPAPLLGSCVMMIFAIR